MIEFIGNLCLGRWYRSLVGGNWKYVGPKYQNYGCWIRNKDPYSWEYTWVEENY